MAYKYITAQSDVDSLLPTLMAQPRWGVDCETTGLDPHKDKVVLLQIGNKDMQYVIDTRRVNVEPLRPFFESSKVRKIGHNFKFDYKMFKGNFGIETETIGDTYYAERILNMGRKFGGFGLDDVLKIYLGVEMSKDEQRSFVGMKDQDFTENQLIYAAKDVEYMVPLLAKMGERLMDDNLATTWSLECSALPCFADMEFAGVYIDVEKWKSLSDGHLKEANICIEELNELAESVAQKDIFGNIYVNWASPEQVVKILQDMRVMVDVWDRDQKKMIRKLIDASDDKTLKKVKDYPIVQKLKAYRQHMIRVTTFGQTYLDAISPVTGRLHPDIDQIGTETGRPANHSKKGSVNFLNIPREKAYRQCFRGAPDELVETHDYSGCELRIWAEISKDPGLTEAFQKGIDVHCYVASKIFKKDVQKKDKERNPAKTLNFGIAYGMSPFSFTEKMNGEGYPISLKEGKKMFSSYEKDFKTGIDFLRFAGETALSQGWLHNKGGRRRYWILPDPEDREKYPKGEEDPAYKGRIGGIQREGGNFLIQSVNADITKMAMVLIREYKKKHNIRTEFMNQVYDELVTRTHKDDSQHFNEIKTKLMLDAAHHYLKTIPMEVEGHVGETWTK